MLVLLAAAGAATAADRQVFRTRVDAVAVDVLVTRGGRPVPGLTSADFTLRDNGVEQRLESVMLEDVPITLLLVLDTSASVEGELLTQLMVASEAAAAVLRGEDSIGLIAFTDRVRLVLAPPAEASSLPRHLETLRPGGGTALYDATFAALALRQRISGRALVLIFSDGEDTASWLDPRDVVTAAQRSDVAIHAVVMEQIVRNISPGDLRRLAMLRTLFQSEPHLFGRMYLPQLTEDTGGALYPVTSAGLRDAFARIVGEFKSRYVLTYSPQGVAERGWHDIDVRVNARGASVRARRGYLR